MSIEKVTIGLINYNGLTTLPAAVYALRKLQYPDFDIVIIDNHSTDGSREWLKENYPEIRCICLDENLGPSAARNIVLEQAKTEYVFIIDNDILVEPDSLSRLMTVMKSVIQAGVCHPEIRDERDPTVHHYNGGWIHFLAQSISRDMPNCRQARPLYEIFDVVSGAALLLRRKLALRIGGFDAEYFFNWEDGDFTARMTLAGYQCLNVPDAIVHHHSKPRGTSKVFYQVRNRWYFMLKLYNWRTLILIAPMLWLFEVLLALFLLKKGSGKEYWRGNLAVVRNLRVTLSKRRAFQTMKKLRDRDWLRAGEMYVPTQIQKPGAIYEITKRAFCAFCNSYWGLIRPFCG